MAPAHELHRSYNRVFAGVCAGLAEYYGWDIVAVRILTVVLTLFTGGAGLIVYLVLWVVMPPPEPYSQPYGLGAQIRATTEEMKSMAQDVHQAFTSSAPDTAPPPPPPAAPVFYQPVRPVRTHRGGMIFGLILIGLGLIALLQEMGFLNWWRWELYWPLIIIAFGALLLLRRV